MNGIALNIIFLLILFIGAWEFYILKAGKGLNHLEKPVFTSVYFAAWSTILIVVFQDRFYDLVSKINEYYLILIPALIFLNWIIYKAANKYLTKPKKLFNQYPEEDFLLMKERYITPKSFDILFQQVMIGLLAVMLYEGGLSLIPIILSFALIFSLLHTPLLKIKDSLGWFYVASSAFSAVVFPTLILTFDNGIIYTYIIHWGFYVLSALFFWFQKNKIFK